jgi:beta-glucosidase-like glycosyl hydrolase
MRRIEELYGEDTHLVARMGVAMVSGIQGGTDPHVSLASNHSVVCTHTLPAPRALEFASALTLV